MRPDEGTSTFGGNQSQVFVHPQTAATHFLAGSDPNLVDGIRTSEPRGNHGSDDGFSDEKCCMCLMVMM